MPASVLAFLLLHDSWFYWTHRLMHRPWWFNKVHRVHHDSRPPTVGGDEFSPVGGVERGDRHPVVGVRGSDPRRDASGCCLAIMTLMGVTNHMGWEMFPAALVNGGLGKWLITASHHELHHHKYRCNYGLYFRHWDRLCGTDRGLGQFATARPPRQASRAVARET